MSAAVAASYVDEPTGDFDRRYYIADHLGSIRVVVNEQGVPIEARDHYPYGLMMPGRTFTAGQETREGYTGHELDAETGMYYAGARYYMSAMGRWTAVDPLAAQYRAISPFDYVGGNPIGRRDPDGREWETEEDEEEARRIQRRLALQEARHRNNAQRARQRLNQARSRGARATRLLRLENDLGHHESMANDLSMAIGELDSIGATDAFTFTFNQVQGNSADLEMREDGVIQVNHTGTFGNKVHELKHAYQVLEGRIRPRVGIYHSLTTPSQVLEVEAYQRQFAADSRSLPPSLAPVPRYIYSTSDWMRYVIGIWMDTPLGTCYPYTFPGPSGNCPKPE